MIFSILYVLISHVFATPAEQQQGKFHVSGMSFDGKIAGDIIVGAQGELDIRLQRPSGLSLFSFTYTGSDVCLYFDMDSTQYKGSASEFNTLFNNVLPAEQLHSLFAPNPQISPNNWQWTENNKNNKIKELHISDIQTKQEVMEVQYRQFRKSQPTKFALHILRNDWKLKANIQQRNNIDWNFSCATGSDIVVLPLEKMLQNGN
jgi:hypothetical protein